MLIRVLLDLLWIAGLLTIMALAGASAWMIGCWIADRRQSVRDRWVRDELRRRMPKRGAGGRFLPRAKG